jgi:error-prone DNA polymerase
MGFYDSQTLIQDAKRRGITVHSVDIRTSGVHATLEPDTDGHKAIRRGLTSVTGLSEDTARTIVKARTEQPFADLEDFARRTHLPTRLMEQLATAGAFDAFGDHRRTALWAAGTFPHTIQPYLPGLGALAPAPNLPPMTPAEQTAADLATTGASATTHPVHHARTYLNRRGALTTATMCCMADQTRVRLGGLAKYLQRPPTAHGVAFGALEDETGMINLIFSPPVWERCQRTLLEAPAVLLDGHVERAHGAINLIVHQAEGLTLPAPASRRRRHGR